MAEPKLRFKREDGMEYPEWEEKAITELCESVVGGGTPATENKDYWNGDIAWISSSDLNGNDIHHLSITRFITEEAIRCSATKKIPRDSVLIVSRVGVGKVVVAPCELCTSQDFTNIVKPKCNSLFLGYMLSIIMQIKANGVQGTSVKGVTAKEIKQYKVSIPCFEEQQKIANFLSTVDEVIAQSVAEVQNLEQQKKAAMQKIFSQEVRFRREDGTEYPEWENDKIGNCVNVTSCKRVHQSDWTDEGIPFYRAREIVALYNNEPIFPLHISNDTYNTFSNISGMISKGDLLITGVGTIGIPYLVKESDKFYFKDGNIIWFQNKEDRILGSFLFYVFGTDALQTHILNNSGKGTVHTFTIANAKETTILVPCLEEQQKIADLLSSYDEAIAHAKQELDKWKELKKGLLQQMFV